MSSITQRINLSLRAVRASSVPLLVLTLALSVLGPACSTGGDDSTQVDVAGAGNGGHAGSAGSKGPARSGSGGQADGGSDFAGSNASDGGDDAHGESGGTSATGGSDSGGAQSSAAGGAGDGDTGGGGGPAATGGVSGAFGGGPSAGAGGTPSSNGGGSGVGGSTTGASCFVDHDCINAGGVCTGVASGSVCVDEQDTCVSDADCSRKQYCDGYCRPAAGFGQPCSSSGRCGIGPPGYAYPLVCDRSVGRCLVPYQALVYQLYPCAADDDCGDGSVCRLAGVSPGYPQCLSPSGPGGRCGGAADCQDGLCCVSSPPVAVCQAKPSCGVTGGAIDCNTRACPTNTHCDYVQASSCLANLPEGSDCTPVAGKETYGSIPCAEGLYCGETVDHLLRCQTSSSEGEPCVLPKDQAAPGQPACSDSFQLGCSRCALGLYCDAGNMCRRPAGYHENCAATPCATGLRCVPATLGGSCTGATDPGAGGSSGGSAGSGGQPANTCSDPPSFRNPALAAVVADQMRRAGVTHASDMQALSYVGDYTIGDLSGLECLTGLKSLTLQGSAIHDLSALSALTQLTNLQVQGTGVSDLHALSTLSNLTTLSLTASAVVDLSPLVGLTGLTTLNLSSNAIVDLTPISGLVHLTTLTLSANQILDLHPLLDNPGIATGSSVSVASNPFDCGAQAANMKALTDRGVNLSVSCPLHCDGTAPQNPASKVAVGADSQCVLLRDGRVECWGTNQYFQLGDGTQTDSTVPVLVLDLSSAVDVAVGETGACALLSSGEVRCWGKILSTANVSPSADPIAGVSQATAIATDSSLVCAIVSDGKVQCWGWNTEGGWGDGSQPGLFVSSAPSSYVLGISGAISIAASGNAACAVLSDGTAWCWGSGLGNGTQSDSNVPVRVPGITNARKVFAGADRRCLLLSDGTVRCWGPWETAGSPTVPTAVPGLTQVVDVALGEVRACAVLQNGTVRCWGRSPLGDGLLVDSDTPVLVSGISNAVGIGVALNANAVCALLTDGSIRCWGWALGSTGPVLLSPDCIPKL